MKTKTKINFIIYDSNNSIYINVLWNNRKIKYKRSIV